MDKRLLALVVFAMVVIVLVTPMAFAKPGTRAAKACRDGMDNDGDGYIDWPSDPGCSSKNDNSELNPNVECDDGVDNADIDLLADYNDPGCTGPTDTSELGTVECDDGSDNDGDGNVDVNDNGCASPSGTDETDCGDGQCEGGETSGSCPADCGVPDSCSDTDGGNIITVFGTTSGYLDNSPYSNDDYCTDSSNIMEYYCSGDYEQSQQQSCGTDGYIGGDYCINDSVYKDYKDYFCASGECDYSITPTLQENCDDNDGYGSNYCLNDSVYRDYNNYYCSSGTCAYTATPEFVEDCEYGCASGQCNNPPDSCSDTDGGYNLNVTGTVSGYSFGYPYNLTDFCVNGSAALIEYYCDDGYTPYTSDYIECNCYNGACV
jgi:hypothetical protein